ncbi:MAG TPA: ferritin-like protein [Gemmatimonadaceae bacterium]|nr:ferritin-like protein [Gemmatimonadaceae bacterium]
MPITDRVDLWRHLQWALELEHATIPPYLCALYSIPDGANTAAVSLIRAVVMEEMLHMTLVANLLNSVGGEPKVDHPKFVPKYPTYLPHSQRAFLVSLLPFSPEALDTFLRIERPAKPGARPQANRYHTIGQFYEAIADGLERLTRRYGEKKLFSGKRRFQIAGSRYYYGGGGEPIGVTDLASARRAIAEIAEQGEGLDHTIFDGDERFGQVDELAHYFRFNEIRSGRRYVGSDSPASGPTGAELPIDWSARYPMRANPRASQYRRQPEVHRLMVEFNRRYTALLGTLHGAFNGKPQQLLEAAPQMYELKYRAQALMAIPTGRADGSTVGPSFEYAR